MPSMPHILCGLLLLAQSVWGKDVCSVTGEGEQSCVDTLKEGHAHDEAIPASHVQMLQQQLRLQGSLAGDSNLSATDEDLALLQLHASVAHPFGHLPVGGGELNPVRPDPEGKPLKPRVRAQHDTAGWSRVEGRAKDRRHASLAARRSSNTTLSEWCGYDVQSGFISALTQPASDQFYMDITDELESEGAVRFMVTAMATTGTYADSMGYLTQYAYPQEDLVSTYFELRRGSTDDTVDVYYPQLNIRTSDNQTENAVNRGIGSGWHDTLSILQCSSSYGNWIQRGGGDGNSFSMRGADHDEPEGGAGLDDATSLLETQRNSSSSQAPKTQMVIDGGYLLQQGFYTSGLPATAMSYRVLSVKAFPNNFDVTAEFAMSDGYPLQLGFSLVKLRKEPMAARAADDRLLYFAQSYQDLGWHNTKQDELPNDAMDRQVSSIWRYNLDALPDNQIKIYVDPTVPERWRPAFRDGIELWNDAFALIGRPTAVKAVLPEDAEWPADYDVADARFNTITWVITTQVVSMGIAKVDPRSGEILKSDITMSDGWVRSWLGDLDLIAPEVTHRVDLNGGWRSESLIDASDHRAHKGRAGLLELHEELQREIRSNEGRTHSSGEWGKKVSLLSTVDGQPMTGIQLQKIMSQGLKSIVAHEAGHILGLRHNFKGSMGISYECTRNISCTAIHGLTNSVMDYLPTNAPPLGIDVQDLHVFTPVLGAYDKLAIQYGYMNATDPTPGKALTLAPEVRKVLEQAEAYETCYDDDRGMEDPACAAYDLSSDPLRYHEEELERLALIQRHLLNASVQPGASYTKYGESVLNVLSLALSHGLDCSTWLGGVLNHYAYRRPDGGVAPVRTVGRNIVPAARQRKAVELVLKVMRPKAAGLLPPDEGMSFLIEESVGQGSVHTLDVESKVRTMGSSLASSLLGSTMLTRMHDLERMAPADASEPPMSVGEYLELVVTGVYGRQGTINASKSDWDLQTVFLDSLTHLYKTDGSSSLPEEVLSQVLGQLRRIHGSSNTALLEVSSSASSGPHREHLLSLRQRVTTAVCGQSVAQSCEALQSPTAQGAAASPQGVLAAAAALAVGAAAASAA